MINIGLIGYGYWGKIYVKTLLNIKTVKLCWVCNKKTDITKQELPARVRFTKNYHDILADDTIDAVIISTPPKTHYAITKAALEAGKDVLVEKPLTDNAKDAKQLLNLAHKNAKILMVGHIFLYNPAIIELKQQIDNHELGDPYYFSSRRTSMGPVYTDVNVLWSLAPHDISIINYLNYGEMPKVITANGACYLNQGVEDVVDLVMEYKNNVKAFVHLSCLEPKRARETLVVAEKKNAIFEDTAENKLIISSSNNPQQKFIPKLNRISPLENQCLHFFYCIKTRKSPLTDGYHGYQIIKILEYAQQSLETGKPVLIS